ncbi:DUF2169 domain-containing protein [Massilia sp. W12]|uniref:DUF2169 family type VI secretion system accessory protein n=1 Tax=Massilia sp. W12 TaxID=3126507 RepID=UPI0030CD5169
MELLVASKYLQAAITAGQDKTGQEYLLIVVKGCWSIVPDGAAGQAIARLAPADKPAQADTFAGAPGLSAPIYESDFALFKPRCDVLFHAQAYAPNGQPATEIGAGFRLDALEKLIHVTGPSRWYWQDGAWQHTLPQAFQSLPLRYDYAFGGAWHRAESNEANYFLQNPVGLGFCHPDAQGVMPDAPGAHGASRPCLRPWGSPAVNEPYQEQTAIALSPVARHWQPRQRYAGTYDETWQTEVFPFLPQDFDDRFAQAAPADQQIDYPKGGEQVSFFNLHPDMPQLHFRLPRFDRLPMRVLLKSYQVKEVEPVVDTLFFEPDKMRFSAVWRSRLAVDSLHQIRSVVIGKVCKNWWEAKSIGAENCTQCKEARKTNAAAPQATEDCPE